MNTESILESIKELRRWEGIERTLTRKLESIRQRRDVLEERLARLERMMKSVRNGSAKMVEDDIIA